jgi:hypothetical protein
MRYLLIWAALVIHMSLFLYSSVHYTYEKDRVSVYVIIISAALLWGTFKVLAIEQMRSNTKNVLHIPLDRCMNGILLFTLFIFITYMIYL